MLTKEEILDSKYRNNLITRGLYDYVDFEMTDRVLEAMEEYAKQEAIEFKNWFEKTEWATLIKEYPMQSLIPIPSNEQLYKTYVKERNKKEGDK